MLTVIILDMLHAFVTSADIGRKITRGTERSMSMTNEQRIKAMTTEELANYLFERGNCQEYCADICSYQRNCDNRKDDSFCIKKIMEWLRQEQEHE